MARKKKNNNKKQKQNKPKINMKKAASIANDALEFCRSGDYARGILLLHKAEERSENNNQIFYNLAIAYHAVNNYSQAEKYYSKAIKSKVDNTVKILQRGINELALNKIESAECCIKAVAEIAPDEITSKLAMASINLRKGNREIAVAGMRECYRTEPKMTSAIMELAEFGELSAEDINNINNNLDKNIIDDKNKKFTYLALAKGYEFNDNYHEAFKAYKEAQDRFATEAQITNYQAVADLQGHLANVKSEINSYFIDKFAGVSDAGKGMVFITGLPKSGLHKASFLLQQSEDAEICGELNWCNEKIYHLLQNSNNDFAQALSTIDKQMIDTLISEYQNICRQRVGSNKVSINCKTTNFVNIWLIKVLFPKAKVVYAKRNATDQALAAYFTNTPGMEYLNDLQDVEKYCELYTELMEYWQRLFNDDIVVFDYDDFIAAPQAAYNKLIADVGIKDAGLTFTESNKPSLNVCEIFRPKYPLRESYRDYIIATQNQNQFNLDFNNFNTNTDSTQENSFKLSFESSEEKNNNGLKLDFGNSNDNKDDKKDDEFKLNFLIINTCTDSGRSDEKKIKKQTAGEVALGYDLDKNSVPTVLAKGAGKIAAKIIELAEENNIPVTEDADLVMALSQLDLGAVIPAELYPAVAEVLAYVYKMNGKQISK